MRTIVKAAIKVRDKIYTGFEHGECFKKFNQDFEWDKKGICISSSELEQGFITSNGEFVDRKEAMVIAKESGQLSYETDKQTLISEDLHLNWLNSLKAELAESEKKREYLFSSNCDYVSQIEELKHQLAEKDAELERIREINLYNKDLAETTLKQLTEKEKEYKRLLHIASKMHLWIFNNTFDEQAVYDELGLTDEENALLGYGGEFKFKIKEKK